ncbi:MAG: DNA replication and repair protein RecF [Opitutales bacterium]
MRLQSLNLVDFRNVETARLSFSGKRIFFVGENGQGKTNLLEAIGFSSALRSFRTTETRDLIRWDRPRAELLFRFENQAGIQSETLLALDRSKSKEVSVDGENVTRFGDFIGRFPSIVFCSDDLRLPRGGPGERRKFLDLALASAGVDYLESLRRYHRALRGRNALLRRDAEDAELSAFEAEMSFAASDLIQSRKDGLISLGQRFSKRYQSIGGEVESSSLRYLPDMKIEGSEEVARSLRDNRSKDRQAKTTQRGPHRDDFTFLLDGRDARKFASEGQQRSMVLALRFGQADFLLDRLGVRPLILADDVLGELDSSRRSNFRSCLDDDSQVFATGTKLLTDDSDDWEIFQTKDGHFLPA